MFFNCTRTGAGCSNFLFETGNWNNHSPAKGLGVTRDVKDTEDNYTGNREELLL